MKSENFDPNDPIQMGYTLQGSMKGSADLVGKGYADVHTYMRKFGGTIQNIQIHLLRIIMK